MGGQESLFYDIITGSGKTLPKRVWGGCGYLPKAAILWVMQRRKWWTDF